MPTEPYQRYHEEKAAGGIALINTLGQLGGIVSPVMVGRVKDLTGSTTPALYLIGCLSVVCAAILMYGMPAKLRVREEPLGRRTA